MNFLAPNLLWGLLALIPLSLIYFLKVRPRRKQTNAYFLWEKILQEKAASALFRRLRDVLSLLLMALVVAMIVMAMARPKLQTDDGRDLLLVIDQSPSMAAGDDRETVFEEAKKEATNIVRALDGSRRLAVVGLADRLDFASHLSDSPKDLLDAIEGMKPSPVPISETAIREVNRLADGRDSRVIFLTDGHGGLGSLSEKVETIRLKGPTANAGIVAADLAWVPGKNGVVSFFYKVASSFPTDKSAELILKDATGSRILRVIPILLQPGISEGETIEVGEMVAGSWVAELEVADSLPADNTVVMGLNEQRRIRVAVSSDQPYFFERSLEAFAQAGGLQMAEVESAEVLLTDQGAVTSLQQIVFRPEGESVWWQDLGEALEQPVPLIKAEGHPLLRHLEAESINFSGARQLTAPEGSVVLVESESGIPLLYKARADGMEAIVVNLDPSVAEFFLSPWFPVLIYDGALNLTGEEASLRTVYPVGSRIDFPGESESPALWTNPKGQVARTTSGELRQTGLHRLQLGADQRVFGVGLLRSEETLLDGSGPAASDAQLERGRMLGWWLLAIALVFVCVESILYHRRKLG
ncbi:BatA and WFA domain-containing protein [Roseibacillus persicicus]|uniref:VWA domain-containing protein n=1 Tax=Roseibacillus persicicus TaxID=454148 RepID=UPI00398B7B6B